MPVVESKFDLNPNLLTVPVGFHEPRLRQAGMAWLAMAVELFNEEMFSILELSWHRPINKVPVLTIKLDSSKNFRTKPLLELPDAPALIYKRRERLDAALAKLMSRTTPEDLWAALANSTLACISAYTFIKAWSSSVGPELGKDTYPRISNAEEFLFHIVTAWEIPSHPWL